MVFLWQPWKDCDKMIEQQRNIASLLPQELKDLLAQMGEPAFRAEQIFSWIHQKTVSSYDEMSNLPAALRTKLAEGEPFALPVPTQKQVSADGTVKYLLTLPDGNSVEAVLMSYNYGDSLCISSQIGCRMGCRFCASTMGGLVRNLTADEMAGEVYAVQKDSGRKVSHIVLMGIGEPLDNLDEVLRFLQIINHPKGQCLSMRNISVSTCGLVPAILSLAEKRLGITLSVSLHAPDDETRSSMMPVNNRYPVAQLIDACREYQKRTGRRISYEYAMVRGVNDTPQMAEKLAFLLKGMGAHINLIPINPVDGSPYGASDRQAVLAFQKMLQDFGMNATVRRRLGVDISAACGQLRRQAIQEAGHEG